MPDQDSSPQDERIQEEQPETSNSSALLKIGTLVVLGAMAANVFGFRYSRWAVGKEIHRGWETHARNTARQAARARANARQQAEFHAQAHTRARQQAKAEEQARAEERAREYARREERAEEERDSTRRAYQRWEQTFKNSGFQGRVRVEFDPRFEEMFKGPFAMHEEVLREFLRAAQMGQTRTRRVDDFDPFKFWEEVHSSQWRNVGGSGPGMGGKSGNSGIGGAFSGNRARYYAALGVRESASSEEIKAAYRREVMKWHPDRYRGNDKAGAERRFREVTEAYEALK